MDFAGKSVIVTGAASGIGRATALRFAKLGAAAVACLDIHEEGNAETARLVAAAGVRALPVKVDLGIVTEIAAAYQYAADRLGAIDAAAHVGGYSWRGNTLDVTEAQWDAMVDVNLRGCFFCCQAALRIMYAQGRGAIVNMSADAAFHPMEGFAVQAAAKGGIVQMTQTLALEAARRGVRVNVVSPGIVQVRKSGFVAAHGAAVDYGSNPPAPLASIDALAQQIAPGRWIEADEVAATIAWLCSDSASGVSGELMFVNGGGYYAMRF